MNKHKSAKKIARAKNMIRGAIALERESSRPNHEVKDWQQERTSKQQIDKALQLAKRSLNEQQYASFEAWSQQVLMTQRRATSNVGASLTSLGIFPKQISSTNLASELRIAGEHLSGFTSILREAALLLGSIASALDVGDLALAKHLTDERLRENEASYALLETHLYIVCKQSGVDAMKAEIRRLSVSTSGYNKFILYHLGLRNEPSQVSGRYKSLVRRRVDESGLVSTLRIYSKYRLYGHLDPVSSELADVLAAEAVTSKLDRSITCLRVSQLVLALPSAFTDEERERALEIQELLNPIGIALMNMRDMHGDHQQSASIKPAEKLKNLFSIAIDEAVGCDVPRLVSGFDQIVVDGLASQLSTRSDGLGAEGLSKAVLNLPWIPILSSVADFGSIGSLASVIKQLDTTATTFEHKTLISLMAEELRARAAESSLEGPERKTLRDLIVLKLSNSLENIDLVAVEAASSRSDMLRDLLRVVLASSYQQCDDVAACLDACVYAGIANDRLIPFLPLQDIFQGVKFGALAPYANSVDLSIALDFYLRIDDDRKYRTNKRYAVEELMKSVGATELAEVPSKLNALGVPVEKIEYFCIEACDKVTIELLPGLGNSKAVMQMQAKILREIAKLHTSQAAVYDETANAIDEQLLVDDGINALDESMVYVDSKAVLNFVNKEYAADFQRYLSLVATGQGVAEPLSEVLKNILSPSAKSFQIPKNDADDLFTQMVYAILERFKRDPVGGLDTIVGRRIRHGTISSELRGALEFVDLIGQKPRAGAAYDAPSRIVKVASRYEPRKRRIINAAFARFSGAIDALIGVLRDERFQITSPEKPRGAFDIQLNGFVLAYARTVAQSCKGIEQFAVECLDIFWLMLSVRSEAIRPTVEAEASRALQGTFEKLMSELRGLNLNEPHLMESLQQSSDELQRRAVTISSWIRVPAETGMEGKTYSMQRIVDVSVAFVGSKYPTHRPSVHSIIDVNFELDAHGFSMVSDMLQIALVNITEHSGLKGGWVEIGISGPNERNLISFHVRNSIGSGIRTNEREAKIAGMLSDISKRTHSERARKDKGSGLSKLAVIVLQSSEASISFGFESDSVFFLKFDLFYVGLTEK